MLSSGNSSPSDANAPFTSVTSSHTSLNTRDKSSYLITRFFAKMLRCCHGHCSFLAGSGKYLAINCHHQCDDKKCPQRCQKRYPQPREATGLHNILKFIIRLYSIRHNKLRTPGICGKIKHWATSVTVKHN